MALVQGHRGLGAAVIVLLLLGVYPTFGQSQSDDISVDEIDASHGREMMLEYFAYEVNSIRERWLEEFETKEDWKTQRSLLRQRYAEMLGLWPMPERTDLSPMVTDTIIRDGIEVRKLHF